MAVQKRHLAIALAAMAAGTGLAWNIAQEPRPPPPTPVTMQLDWFHKGDYGGFYAADRNGYYADESVAVTFIAGGPQHDVITPVLEGKVKFGLANGANLVSMRAHGHPVRAVACIYRRSPLVFAAMSDSGIVSPEDFSGKTIRVARDSRPMLDAVLSRVGVAPGEYTVSRTRDLADFYAGKVDVWVGYIIGSVRLAREQGHDLNLIHPDNYGVHAYEDCIFATDDVIAREPDLIRRFLRATFRGWEYAIRYPETAGAMTAAYMPEAKLADEVGRLTAALPLINTGEDHVGWMKPNRWEAIAANLRDMGIVNTPLDVSEVYTMRFLEEIYQTDG